MRELGWQCTFVSEKPPGTVGGVANIQYRPGGAADQQTHVLARTFENGMWHAAGVYQALRPVSAAIRPDVIVGHSGWGSTVLLRELYPEVPVVNYFEYFYRPTDSDLDFRHDVPVSELDRLRSPARNAMILLDLEYCAAGYSPTAYQRELLPTAYQRKLHTIHDGIDTDYWQPPADPSALTGRRQLGNLVLQPGEKLLTYVSRGLEMMRGFDVFMKAAKLICERDPAVRVVIVGSEDVAYGGDLQHTGGRSFRDHVLAQDEYDLSRIHFTGRVAPEQLRQLLAITDLHVYLTVPFVLSWSCLNAMACGATVLGSATAPVREVIEDGVNGLLVDFFDHEALAEHAITVLQDPVEHRRTLGAAARATIEQRYALDVTFPQLTAFFAEVAARLRRGASARDLFAAAVHEPSSAALSAPRAPMPSLR